MQQLSGSVQILHPVRTKLHGGRAAVARPAALDPLWSEEMPWIICAILVVL